MKPFVLTAIVAVRYEISNEVSNFYFSCFTILLYISTLDLRLGVSYTKTPNYPLVTIYNYVFAVYTFTHV